MKITTENLKKIFVTSGYISEEEFDGAVKSASDLGKDIADVLIFRGLIKEEALSKLISEYLKVPYANIKRYAVTDEILSLIPEKMARTYRLIPFEKEGKKLKVALENPNDFEALEFAKRQTGLQIVPHYTNRRDLTKALGQYKRNIKVEFDKVIAENVKRTSLEDDLVKAAEKLPIIKILDTILSYAIAERASDIHIETQAEEVVVRFRIDGVLRDVVKLPRGIETAIIARVKILSNLKIDEHRIPQDGRYKFKVDEDIIALRISIIPGFYGESVVMRLLK